MPKTVSKPEPKTATVQIEAKVYDPKTLFFRVDAGTAKADGKEWELSLNVGGSNPIIRLPDGRWVTFSWPSLIEAANLAGAQK